ncbi:MAG: hypothetical protein V4591_10805 [Bdellovibrionota bacterium]
MTQKIPSYSTLNRGSSYEKTEETPTPKEYSYEHFNFEPEKIYFQPATHASEEDDGDNPFERPSFRRNTWACHDRAVTPPRKHSLEVPQTDPSGSPIGNWTSRRDKLTKKCATPISTPSTTISSKSEQTPPSR